MLMTAARLFDGRGDSIVHDPLITVEDGRIVAVIHALSDTAAAGVVRPRTVPVLLRMRAGSSKLLNSRTLPIVTSPGRPPWSTHVRLSSPWLGATYDPGQPFL